MFKFFISSDATPDQSERFVRLNAHVPDLVRSVGVDEHTLDAQAMRQMNLISAECLFSHAAFAQALSHVALWGNVAQHQTAAHVFESNAVLCANFEAESTRILASLPQAGTLFSGATPPAPPSSLMFCPSWPCSTVQYSPLTPPVAQAR